jgi:DDE superfamily endonuclease
VCDGLPAYRSGVVREYVDALDGRNVLERLPGYAPELNPLEYLFGYAKQRELARLCADTTAEVRGLCLASAQVGPTPADSDPSLLEAGGVAAVMPCTYVKLSK